MTSCSRCCDADSMRCRFPMRRRIIPTPRSTRSPARPTSSHTMFDIVQFCEQTKSQMAAKRRMCQLKQSSARSSPSGRMKAVPQSQCHWRRRSRTPWGAHSAQGSTCCAGTRSAMGLLAVGNSTLLGTFDNNQYQSRFLFLQKTVSVGGGFRQWQ